MIKLEKGKKYVTNKGMVIGPLRHYDYYEEEETFITTPGDGYAWKISGKRVSCGNDYDDFVLHEYGKLPLSFEEMYKEVM